MSSHIVHIEWDRGELTQAIAKVLEANEEDLSDGFRYYGGPDAALLVAGRIAEAVCRE